MLMNSDVAMAVMGEIPAGYIVACLRDVESSAFARVAQIYVDGMAVCSFDATPFIKAMTK